MYKDLVLPNGEKYNIIELVDTQCYNFGPFEYPVSSYLGGYFRSQDKLSLSQKIQEYAEFTAEALGNQDEQLQNLISFTELSDMIYNKLLLVEWIIFFTNIAEEEGFSVDVDDDEIYLNIYSPAGQDSNHLFSICDTYDKTEYDFSMMADAFDPDAEALLWVDANGHGKNGAPYRLRDILEDMEWIKNKLDALNEKIM